MAPVLGIVVFLPLVLTVMVQIIWRFRSSEFVYCWIPRTPVYARWIAIDGWRFLIILGIIIAYIRIAHLVYASKKPKLCNTPDSASRYSAIDSAASNISDGRGLFSQSIHNIHRWAWSKLGLADHKVANDSEYQDSSTQRPTRSYYETFKRSFVLNIVRRFFLTVDIPSPTIPESIFNQCGKDQGSILTHCDKHSMRSTTESSDLPPSIQQESDGLLALKRWYSAVSRLVSRRSQVLGHPLRRSHTAPVLTSDAMGLCSCVFKRRGGHSPEPMDQSISRNQTLTVSPPAPCVCHQSPHIPRSISVKRRYAEPLHISTLGIYTHGGPFSVYSDESSAQIVEIEAVEKLVSLEDGHWTKVVEKCRGERKQAFADEVLVGPGSMVLSRRSISRLYVYPLAYLLIWMPSIFYYVLSTYVYYTGFQSGRLDTISVHTRSLDMSRLPAHWTPGQNMNRMWPYYQRLTAGIWGSEQLGWLAIIQSLHMLSGAVDALLFWLTE
ncbi:hypothetical protein GGI19_005989 [Coemansia pectinata]|uniref:Uncharacterized protein n=1 Tax=Coemansia pectinata TaxID=1052879 RepID=A0A9W8GUZ6_9FUNG|nr:hypothetical protein GGI19_005989 [Coemansia pectinata]